MQPDKIPDGGRFRLRAATTLDRELGPWGADNMICVALDPGGSGRFVAAGPTDCIGVVYTEEGRRIRHYNPDPMHPKRLRGGDKYTILHNAEFVEAQVVGTGEVGDDGFTPVNLEEGDLLYAAENGSVTTAPDPGAIFVGFVAEGGDRVVININGLPPAAGS